MTQAQELEPLYVLAVHMLGSRDAAFVAVSDVIGAHPGEPTAWLGALLARLIADEKPARVDRFSELDDILRTNSTIPVDLGHPLVRGDARRLNVLLSELQRSCLIATLRALAPERRAVFVLVHVLGLSIERCAELCDTTASAVRVTEGRGRRDLDNYLGSRCEHIDAANPCRCAARLGNALERGLVDWPAHNEHDGATFAPEVHRQVGKLYASLTRVRLPVV